MRSIQTLQLINLPLSALSFVPRAMFTAAIFRAVLEPQRSEFAYIRFGMQEFWVGAVLFVQGLLFGFGFAAAAIPIIIVVTILALTKLVAAAVIVGVAGAVAGVVALIYLAIRFSMGVPMSFAERNFRLFESWNLTKGHTGSLLTIALAIVGIVLLLELVLAAIGAALGFAAMAGFAGGPAGLQAFFSQPPAVWLRALGPLILVATFVWAAASALFTIVITAPWADAYRQLRPVDVDATFG